MPNSIFNIFDSFRFDPTKKPYLKVKFQRLKRSRLSAEISLVFSVHESKLKKVIIHHEYDRNAYMNDIALIELEECVPTLNQFRAPICLPTCKFQQ